MMGKEMGVSPEGIRYYRSIQRDVNDPGYLILLLPSCNCYEDCSQTGPMSGTLEISVTG